MLAQIMLKGSINRRSLLSVQIAARPEAWDTALARAKGFWKTFRQQPNKVYYDLLFLERSKDIVSTLN